MARSTRQTLTGTGSTAPVPLSLHLTPFNVSVAVIVSPAATVSFTVEHTFDDVFAASFTPAAATWFPHSDIAADTANVAGNYAFPVTAVRLTASANDGMLSFVVTQAGIT
jgi:hypothetical protein